jgi:hypothetical protein
MGAIRGIYSIMYGFPVILSAKFHLVTTNLLYAGDYDGRRDFIFYIVDNCGSRMEMAITMCEVCWLIQNLNNNNDAEITSGDYNSRLFGSHVNYGYKLTQSYDYEMYSIVIDNNPDFIEFLKAVTFIMSRPNLGANANQTLQEIVASVFLKLNMEFVKTNGFNPNNFLARQHGCKSMNFRPLQREEMPASYSKGVREVMKYRARYNYLIDNILNLLGVNLVDKINHIDLLNRRQVCEYTFDILGCVSLELYDGISNVVYVLVKHYHHQ